MVRGDVFEVVLPQGRGRVQHGRRYAVIVQSNELLGLSTALVCPTSTAVRPASFRPEVQIGEALTRVLCEQVSVIDARSITKQAGHLTLDEIRAVDAALELVLDLGR